MKVRSPGNVCAIYLLLCHRIEADLLGLFCFSMLFRHPFLYLCTFVSEGPTDEVKD